VIFRLNRNLIGPSVLHVEHPFEACNTDDAKGMESVDELTAAALLDTGAVVKCQHCKPVVGAETGAADA
jgi:hypothetical protein